MMKNAPAGRHRNKLRMRILYPYPSEIKRFRKESFQARMSTDGYAGYVADVTYEGTAVYPDAPAPYKAAPVPAYAG